MATALALAVIAPIMGSIAVPLLVRWSRRVALLVAVVAVCGSVAALATLAPTAYRGVVRTAEFGGMPIGITLSGDAFSVTTALVAAVVGAIALLATLSGFSDLGRRELGGYGSLSLLLVAACIAGALTADLLNLFVWFEVAALASYGLTGFFLERPPAVEAAFKIAALTNIAGFLVFIGMAMLYQAYGVVNMAELYRALAVPARIDAIALGLLLAGFATKAGLIPFHGWLPDAHTAAPGPISALFSGVLVNFGIVAMARIAYSIAAPAHLPIPGILLVLGVVSALAGAGFALVQDDLKRLLAYDTISQMGIIIVGLATASATGAAGAIYHLISHALFKSLLFLVAGAIVHSTGATALRDVSGLSRRSPWLVGLFLLGALAIAGIPPFNGYVSLGLIHDALLSSHQYAALAAVLIAQVITVAALGRVVAAFFRRPSGDFSRDETIRPGLLIALSTLAVACIATGIPTAILDHVVNPAASVLAHPQRWSTVIINGSGSMPPLHIAFGYAKPTELFTVGLCIVLGLVLMVSVRRWTDAIRHRLESIATGSVNDYVAYLASGIVIVVGALLL